MKSAMETQPAKLLRDESLREHEKFINDFSETVSKLRDLNRNGTAMNVIYQRPISVLEIAPQLPTTLLSKGNGSPRMATKSQLGEDVIMRTFNHKLAEKILEGGNDTSFNRSFRQQFTSQQPGTSIVPKMTGDP
jgi:hypothetical protein